MLGYLKSFPLRYTVPLNEVVLTDGEMHQLAVLYSTIITLGERGLLLSVYHVLHRMMFAPVITAERTGFRIQSGI